MELLWIASWQHHCTSSPSPLLFFKLERTYCCLLRGTFFFSNFLYSDSKEIYIFMIIILNCFVCFFDQCVANATPRPQLMSGGCIRKVEDFSKIDAQS